MLLMDCGEPWCGAVRASIKDVLAQIEDFGETCPAPTFPCDLSQLSVKMAGVGGAATSRRRELAVDPWPFETPSGFFNSLYRYF